MAPTFNKNVFKVYDKGSSSIICLTNECYLNDDELKLRDKITEIILEKKNMFLQKVKSGTYYIDSWFAFYELSNKENVIKFCETKYPKEISRIFNLRDWKDYQAQREEITELTLFEMVTSHDYPGLTIENNLLFTKNELVNLIKEASNDIKLDITYQDNLWDIHDLWFSNKKFVFS